MFHTHLPFRPGMNQGNEQVRQMSSESLYLTAGRRKAKFIELPVDTYVLRCGFPFLSPSTALSTSYLLKDTTFLWDAGCCLPYSLVSLMEFWLTLRQDFILVPLLRQHVKVFWSISAYSLVPHKHVIHTLKSQLTLTTARLLLSMMPLTWAWRISGKDIATPSHGSSWRY